MKVMQNQASPQQKNAVVANSAIAIQCYRNELSLKDAVEQATESIEEGKAYQTFQKLIKLQS